MVDIDTSGPEVEVELPDTKKRTKHQREDKTHENERETKLEDGNIQSNDYRLRNLDQQPDVPVQEDKREDKAKKKKN